MANAWYNKLVDDWVAGTGPDWVSADWRVVLIDLGQYTFSQSHQYLSDITAGARIATSGALQNKTLSGGIFDADDITIIGVAGLTVEAFAIYQHTGTAGTSKLGMFFDSGVGVSFTPNSGDVTIQWPSTTNKIAKLGS